MSKKMIVGYKYCGGCNPRFDRGAAFEEIQQQLTGSESIQLVYAREGTAMDHLIVIGGCPACCASFEQYGVAGEIIKMWEQEQVGETVETVLRLADETFAPQE